MVITMPVLTVHVYDEFTRDPVPHAVIRVIRNGRRIAIESTGRNGVAVFTLDKGAYRVRVEDQLHFPQERTVNLVRDMAISFYLAKRTW